MATISGTNAIDNLVGTADGNSISSSDGYDPVNGGVGIDNVTELTAGEPVEVFFGLLLPGCSCGLNKPWFVLPRPRFARLCRRSIDW
jgi:hypothetical protein